MPGLIFLFILLHRLAFYVQSSPAELSRLEQCLEVLNQCQHQHEKILSEFKFLQLMIFKRNGQLRKEKSIQLLKRVSLNDIYQIILPSSTIIFHP